MAGSRSKGTYSLDTETADLLERLARRWKTSTSTALRRAIHAAAAQNHGSKTAIDSRLAALGRFQASCNLTKREADAWARRARVERRASSRKRGF